MSMSINHVAVIGAGAMGRGIAQLLLQSGLKVTLLDQQTEILDQAATQISRMLGRLVEKGKLDATRCQQATASLITTTELADVADVDLVIEAIVERLEVKQGLFTSLEAIVRPDCILASNTSSLSITAIASVCKQPARVAGLHFFNPAPLMKLVEVVAGQRSDSAVCDALVALVHQCGHTPVQVADLPGFVVNHAGRGYSTEALRVLGDQIASLEEIDRIMKNQVGFPMGPFELFDLTGLDVSHAVTESIYNQFYQEPKYRPSPLAARRVEAGLLGRKTTQGFYDYSQGKPQPAALEAPGGPLPERVWISPMCREQGQAFMQALTDLCHRAGVVVEQDTRPSDGALCVLAPLGQDATTTAFEQKLDATRCVAIDGLFGLSTHRVVMLTVATSEQYRNYAHCLFAAGDFPVSVIADSPGFVGQRIIACVVNIASDIAQQGIATPGDIDAAVKLGLGYPFGPLAWGDQIGAQKIVTVLNNMLAITGDPRYRPSLWLQRRAMLNLSLHHTATPAQESRSC